MTENTPEHKRTGRDTSFLDTGLTSRSSRAVAKKKEEARKDAEKEREQLAPYSQVVDQIIEQELANARNFETLPFDINLSEESLKAIMFARKMNIEFIKSFKLTVSTKLRQADKTRRGSHG